MTFDSRFKKEFLEISSEDQRQEIQNNFVNEEQEAEHLEYLNESISELKTSIPSLDFESSIHRSILSSVVGGINLYLEEKLQELIQQDLDNSNYLMWPSDTYLYYSRPIGNMVGSQRNQYTRDYFSHPNTPVYRIRNYCEHPDKDGHNSGYCYSNNDNYPVYTPVYNNEPVQEIVVSNISGGTFTVSEQVYNELGTYGTISEIVTDEDTGNVTLSLVNYNSEFSVGDSINNGSLYSTIIRNSNFTDDINFWDDISSDNPDSKIEWVDSSLKISYNAQNVEAGVEQSFLFDNYTEDTYKLIMSITPTSDIETLELEFYGKTDGNENLLNSLTISGSDSNFDPTQSLYELNLNFQGLTYSEFKVRLKYFGNVEVDSEDFENYILINSIFLTNSNDEDIIIIEENVTGIIDSVSIDQTPDSLYLHDQERIKIPYQINYCYTGIDLKESRQPANDPFLTIPTEPNIRKTVEDYRILYGPNENFDSILVKSTYFDGLDEDNHRTSTVGEQDIILSNISGGSYLIGDIISNENGISGVVKQITFETDDSENVLKTIISMEIYTSIFSAGDSISNSSDVTANIDSVINTRTIMGEKITQEDRDTYNINHEFFDVSPEIFYIEPVWARKQITYMTDTGPRVRETFPELQNRKVVVINKDNDETLNNLIEQAKVVYELYEEMLNGVENFTGSYSEIVYNFQAIEDTLRKKERYITRNQILRDFSGLTTSS